MKVNGKDYPIYFGKIKAMFQTTNQFGFPIARLTRGAPFLSSSEASKTGELIHRLTMLWKTAETLRQLNIATTHGYL